MTKEEKNKGGRPAKIPKFIQAAELYFKEHEGEWDTWIYTDEELLFQINEMLPHEDRISKRTFERWKARVVHGIDSDDEEEKIDEEKEMILNRFWRLIKKALIAQKKVLFVNMFKDHLWQRYAWVIERKFEDWNLKNVSQVEARIASSERIAKIE